MRTCQLIDTESSSVRRRNQEGMAVIVVLALIAIVLIFMAGNIRTIRNLDRDVKLVDRTQTRRLQSTAVSTNALSVINGIDSPTATR